LNPARRRLAALATGCVLAGVLAVILFAGVGTGAGRSGTASVTDRAPGIDPAAADLMQLNVIPPARARPAPPLALVDQHGRPTTLDQFRGKVVVWSLNDDRCTDLCTLLAQAVVAADRDLGPAAKDVVFLSVNANPYYTAPAYPLSWSERNQVESLPNWVYVTGPPEQLRRTWDDYKVTVIPDAKTRTVVHDALLDFIDPSGSSRAYAYFGQGAISTAYYAHAMAQMADDLLPKAQQVKVAGPALNPARGGQAVVGGQAPPFELPALNGSAAGRLSDLDQGPLVLNFWSSTCQPCTSEMPALQQVQKDFGDQLDVVGVDVADPRSSAGAFAARLGVTYRLLADPDGAVAAQYKVTGLPATFIIGPGGAVLARHDGALTAPQLEAVLQEDFQQLAIP